VAAAVPDGLVLAADRELFVWDPLTGRSRPLRLEMGFEAHGSLLAGCARGSDCRELAVVDTATGRTVTAEEHVDPFATFSGGGAQLAAPVRHGRRWSVALVDPATGTANPVPGSGAGEWYPDLAWSADDWLFIRAGARVKAYGPGAARAERLPIRLPRSTIAFAAG
jgi:hypothetical protein